MTTFKFKKPIEDIEDPELLPKDWYKFRIATKPEVQQNSKKTGENLFMRLRLLMPEEELFDGRELPLWLSMPTEEDEKKYDNKGAKISDAKMKRIVNFTECAGGVIDGEEFDLQQGMTVVCYVDQQLDQAGQEMENTINIFSNFKSEEDFDLDEDEEPLEVTD